MTLIQQVQQIINAWEIPFAYGWSIMDIFRLTLLLAAVAVVITYFFQKADTK